MHKLYVAHINRNLNDSEYTRLMTLISSDKKEKINSYRFYVDRQRSLLGEVLARYAICSNHKIANRELHFNYNEYGKPLIPVRHFNISHSGAWVTCAISNKVVGVDVEEIKTL